MVQYFMLLLLATPANDDAIIQSEIVGLTAQATKLYPAWTFREPKIVKTIWQTRSERDLWVTVKIIDCKPKRERLGESYNKTLEGIYELHLAGNQGEWYVVSLRTLKARVTYTE